MLEVAPDDRTGSAGPPIPPPRKRIALFRNLGTGLEVVGTEPTERFCPTYVRVTGYAEVTFPLLTQAEVLANLARIDAALAASTDQHRVNLMAMRACRDQLLELVPSDERKHL